MQKSLLHTECLAASIATLEAGLCALIGTAILCAQSAELYQARSLTVAKGITDSQQMLTFETHLANLIK